jgi:hypothetical protein
MGDRDVSDAAGIAVGAESAIGFANARRHRPHVTGDDALTASADPESSALVLPTASISEAFWRADGMLPAR